MSNKILGAKELQKRITRLGDKKRYQQALDTSGEELLRQAKANAEFRRYPVKNPNVKLTGNLKNSISRSSSTDKVVVGATAKYAGYVEEGTRKMRAQPYLKPAFDKVAPKFKKRVDNVVKN